MNNHKLDNNSCTVDVELLSWIFTGIPSILLEVDDCVEFTIIGWLEIGVIATFGSVVVNEEELTGIGATYWGVIVLNVLVVLDVVEVPAVVPVPEVLVEPVVLDVEVLVEPDKTFCFQSAK